MGDDVQERLVALEREMFGQDGRVTKLRRDYDYITKDPNGLATRLRRMEVRAAIVTVLTMVNSFLVGMFAGHYLSHHGFW